MGRSSSSCFKIMACAGDSAGKGDASPPPESGGSPDKRRWSFRRKSSKHHSPCKSLTSEVVSIKSNLEEVAATFNSEKASVPQQALNATQNDDGPQLLPAVSISRESELVVDQYAAAADYNTQEGDIILLQASIRRYLAKRQLKKFKNAVKLQAYFRGYLVRRQAAGTLRCLLAILKIQALVRRNSAVQSRKLTGKEKLREQVPANVARISEKNHSKTPAAVRTLVANAFACQILKFTPKRKPICIRCDPSQMDSGWRWLERWTSLITSVQQKITSNKTDIGKDMSIDFDACDVKVKSEVTPYPIVSATNLAPSDLPVEAEVKGNLITNCSEKLEHEVPATLTKQCSNTLVQDDQLMSHVEEASTVEKNEQTTSSMVKENSDFARYEVLLSSNATPHPNLHGNMDSLDEACEMPKNGAVKELHETLEMEGGQVLIGSRKSRNPTFAAVQAKFEGLSSASSSNKSHGHANTNAVGESKSVTSRDDKKTEEVSKTKSVHFLVGKPKEVGSTENLAGHNTVTQGATTGGSTDISISAINDSSEAELSTELRILEHKEDGPENGDSSSLSFRDTKVEENGLFCNSNAVQLHGMVEIVKGAPIPANPAKSAQVEQRLTALNTSNIYAADSGKDPEIDKPSQEGSPRSLVTIPESHGTPSSQISKHAKTTTKVESNILARKIRTQSIVKSSPTNSKNDSGTPSSGEQLQKDIKNAKRRNSFGIAKTDHGDHELRSNGSSSLPSYMQPTESARAKINTSISQKSSPDVNDRENHIKKRHSLPSEDGKQDSSPRMQRSTSHAQQNWKGNGVHSPHNSSERRWLR